MRLKKVDKKAIIFAFFDNGRHPTSHAEDTDGSDPAELQWAIGRCQKLHKNVVKCQKMQEVFYSSLHFSFLFCKQTIIKVQQ